MSVNQKPLIKVLTKTEAKKRAEGFCAYQERSHQEMRDRLYNWGLHQADVENLISELIQDNFLNEERFAFAYARGKFRIKNWGKIKIKQGLKLKAVPPKLIQKALNAIDGDEYLETLKKILEKKSGILGGSDSYKKNFKLSQYATSRGFEYDIIMDMMTQMKNTL
ncbi:MAG TPA: regulatory protein RecX [Sphingobacteriaceae bacterium]|nr:regulatory protein RecX [Sphingobacteriaceae bacterium]